MGRSHRPPRENGLGGGGERVNGALAGAVAGLAGVVLVPIVVRDAAGAVAPEAHRGRGFVLDLGQPPQMSEQERVMTAPLMLDEAAAVTRKSGDVVRLRTRRAGTEPDTLLLLDEA